MPGRSDYNQFGKRALRLMRRGGRKKKSPRAPYREESARTWERKEGK